MIPRRVILSGFVLLVLVVLSASSAWAQFTSGIEGTVTDPTGAVVAGATITIKNEETGASQTVQTQDSGFFRFTTLPSSAFTVSASSQGFKTTVQEHVQLQVAETKTVNIHMVVGGTDSTVTVTEEVPQVETSEARVSGQVSEKEVHDLPLSGRNFYTLVVLTPGVSGIASSGGQAYAQATGDIFNPEYGINLNANGSRAESNTFLIDSASIDSSQRNGVTNVNPNAEDVQEVRVAANNYSAEFGRNGAALVNIITKQGTNNWHGTVGFYHTDNKLQARNEFQTKVPVFRRNEGAWSLGGPLWKNHTFVFLSMDILRSGVAFSEAATVLTPDFINYVNTNFPTNVSNQVLQTYILPAYSASGAAGGLNPNSGIQTAGQLAGSNCTGTTIITPDSMGISVPCNLPVTGVANYSATNPRNGFQYTGRIDHSFTDKDKIFLTFDHTDLHQVAFGEPFVYPAFNTIEPTYSEHFAADWVHASNSWVNEAGFSTQRPYGNLSVNDPQVPGIAINGLTPGGNNAETFQQGWGPNAFVQNNFEWRDVASLTRGSHSLKVGGNVTRGRADHESSRVFDRPDFSFNSIFDFANDSATAETGIGFNPVTGAVGDKLYSLMRTGSLSAFVQDDWKVKQNFTLSLGFRYEDFFNPSDATGQVCEMAFPVKGALPTMIANGVMSCRKNMFNHTMNTFSPRIGFAWDPTKEGKMSIRGGIGIFYDRPSDQLDNNYYTNTPRFAVGGAFSNTPNNLPLFALGTSPIPPYNYPLPPGLVPTTLPDLNAQGGLLNGAASVQVVDPNMPAAYMQNWFFGVQRSLAKDWVAEIDYIGSVGRHLYATYNVNRFDGDLIQNGGSFTGLTPGFSGINYGQANENSSYNGLTAALKKNIGNGLTFNAAYTYSKALDDSSRLDGPEHVDAFLDARERGLADFDVRHRLAFTTLWNIPGPHGGGLLNKVLGGWEVTNVTILQSGPPFSAICTAAFAPVFNGAQVVGNTGCDYNADGNNLDYPNTPAFGNTLTGLSRSDYQTGIFSCSGTANCSGVFPAPAFGQEGNLGRNTFHGPGYANTDFSVIKNIRIPWFLGTEGANIQFRTEFFNVFNRVNLTNVNNQINGAAFGKSTSTYPARDIQFALRLAF
ncbi:MAG: carboxypeptidase regulatory-like domain-containing protein [Terriglobales bacterium]